MKSHQMKSAWACVDENGDFAHFILDDSTPIFFDLSDAQTFCQVHNGLLSPVSIQLARRFQPSIN